MVYDKMDFFRIPDFLNTHLTEDFDRQRSSTVLGHRHVCGENSDLARMMDFLTPINLDADYLLGKGKRGIVEDHLRQLGHGRNQNSRY